MKSVLFKILYTLVFAMVAIIGCVWVYTNLSVPSEITFFKGSDSEAICEFPFVELTQSGVSENVVAVDSTSVKALDEGIEEAELSLFGILPLKKVRLKVVPSESVMVSGKLVGLKIRMGELLVVKVDKVLTAQGEISPGENAGIQKGDYILEVNNQKIAYINQFVDIINNAEEAFVDLKIRRNNEIIIKRLSLAKAKVDNSLKAGIWLRDGIAGLGTLTYFKQDGQLVEYGSLGHAITDVDTGVIMPVNNGRIYNASMVASEKGQVGTPGEIKGVINEQEVIGDIRKNTEKGVYGCLEESAINSVEAVCYLPTDKYAVREGAATIFTEAVDNKVSEYQIEIESVNTGSVLGTKGFKIKITDERLLNKTGGIVQGMSGSPILQDGKLVGAVTHVLVNDPTRGYGIFIENMLDAAG